MNSSILLDRAFDVKGPLEIISGLSTSDGILVNSSLITSINLLLFILFVIY